ncbi:MAG TPA: UDP-N-acetylmuramoyl-L-alanyl-D-glutamate--2,6-diaminopimelate ligase, partial [Acidobacteriota bacterium]
EVERAGAAAVLSDQPCPTKLPQIITENPRLALANVSNTFYGDPSTQLKLIGVTGTNGKTTTTFAIRSIFLAAGVPCGLIGTVRYSGKDFSKYAPLTTPEPPELQRLLRRIVEEGNGACAMEVSSQALAQYRVAGCTFQSAVFTNLTHEHLDYHGTMQQYYQAKKMLFDQQTCDARIAIVNRDDQYARRVEKLRRRIRLPVLSYGMEKEADFCITRCSISTRGSQFAVLHNGVETKVRTPLVGKYNVLNICAAFAVAVTNQIEKEAILEGIRKMSYVPGRLEEVHFGQPFKIFIDYAHTHDAFRQLLPTLRLYTPKRLIHIFGCRGKRDRSKRPKMGKISGMLADVVVLTSDNPQTEDPAAIAQEVFEGVDSGDKQKVKIVLDRADAIHHAVRLAQPGDTIVITGKGNEAYQLIGKQRLEFDEHEIFRHAVNLTTEARRH